MTSNSTTTGNADVTSNGNSSSGWDIRLVDRKLTEEETEHVRSIVYSVLQPPPESGTTGTTTSTTHTTLMEEDDIADIAAYCAAMISNEKSIAYVVDEIAVFFTPPNPNDNPMNDDNDVDINNNNNHTIPIQTILGNQLQQYVQSLLSSSSSSDPTKEEDKVESEITNHPSTTTGNALTMSGALGASRDRTTNTKKTVTKVPPNTNTSNNNNSKKNNTRHAKAFDRLTTDPTSRSSHTGGSHSNMNATTNGGRVVVNDGRGRSGRGNRNGSTSADNGGRRIRNENDTRGNVGGGGGGRHHPNQQQDQPTNSEGRGNFRGRGMEDPNHMRNGPPPIRRGGGGRIPMDHHHHQHHSPDHPPYHDNGEGQNWRPHPSNDGGRSIHPRADDRRGGGGGRSVGSRDAAGRRGGGGGRGDGRMAATTAGRGGRGEGRPPLSGQRRPRDDDYDYNQPNAIEPPQFIPTGGGRMPNHAVAGGRGGAMDRGGGSGNFGGRAAMGGRFHPHRGGRQESPPGRGPDPKRIRYDNTHPPPAESQSYDPNVEGDHHEEEYPSNEYEEYYDDGNGHYDSSGYDDVYYHLHTPHYAGGRGWGGRGRLYRGGRAAYGRSGGRSFVSPSGRFGAGRGYPATTDDTIGATSMEAEGEAAVDESTTMNDVTATVVAAHPSPLVAAAYRGRGGGYTFVRGGRGRGRFPGRGGFGGRADVKTLIASKTWVRTRPGDETNEAGNEPKDDNAAV